MSFSSENEGENALKASRKNISPTKGLNRHHRNCHTRDDSMNSIFKTSSNYGSRGFGLDPLVSPLSSKQLERSKFTESSNNRVTIGESPALI